MPGVDPPTWYADINTPLGSRRKLVKISGICVASVDAARQTYPQEFKHKVPFFHARGRQTF